jgi:hypothetical protein
MLFVSETCGGRKAGHDPSRPADVASALVANASPQIDTATNLGMNNACFSSALHESRSEGALTLALRAPNCQIGFARGCKYSQARH